MLADADRRRTGCARRRTSRAFCAISASVCARVVVASWSVSAPRSLSAAIAIAEETPALARSSRPRGRARCIRSSVATKRRCVAPDPARAALSSSGGGTNPKRDSFVAGPSCESAAAIASSTSIQLPPARDARTSCRRRRCRCSGSAAARTASSCRSCCACVCRLWYVAARQLQRPERLDARVRLAEHAEAEDADGDQQGGDQRERDEQLRPHRDRDRGDERGRAGRLGRDRGGEPPPPDAGPVTGAQAASVGRCCRRAS